MQKISLKNLNLKEVEQLSREQLKVVIGGQNLCPQGFVLCGDTCYPYTHDFNCDGNEDEHKAATDACSGKNAGATCTVPGKSGKGQCRQWLTGPLICSFGF